MKLPNGYGSVVKLSGNRRRPYMVRKTIGYDKRGYPQYLVLGYVETRADGMAMLADYNRDPWDVDKSNLTLDKLYQLWLDKRANKLGVDNRKAIQSAYKHCKPLYSRRYCDIKSYQMQEIIDSKPSYSVQGKIKNLFHHLDHFALELGAIRVCYSDLLTVIPAPESSRVPFTDQEIDTLWDNLAMPWVDSVLVYIYAGWRLNELLYIRTADVDLAGSLMTSGNKTPSGKGRIVPIHSRIMPLIQARADLGYEYLFGLPTGRCSPTRYYQHWHNIMDTLGMDHVVHDCRHTFRSRLDSAGANQVCINLLIGHKGKTVGERVYTHKTIDELRETIELLA